jgi:hypothetical protein
MPGKRDQTKTTKKDKPLPPVPSEIVEDDTEDNIDFEELAAQGRLVQLEETDELDKMWPGMYDAEPGQDVSVHIRRLLPETAIDPITGQEWRCKGYCGVVPPGHRHLDEYVSKTWGGGRMFIRSPEGHDNPTGSGHIGHVGNITRQAAGSPHRRI